MLKASRERNCLLQTRLSVEEGHVGHLIRALKRDEIELLPEIYRVLANCYLTHRSGGVMGPRAGDEPSLEMLIDSVQATEEMVPLAEAREELHQLMIARVEDRPPLIPITKVSEQPAELFNCLGQIGVLSRAVEKLLLEHFTFSHCAPTQQDTDADGNKILDLEGFSTVGETEERWCLEAYGGKDLKNNRKLYKDMTSLLATPTDHRFLAFRSTSWTWKNRLEVGIPREMTGAANNTEPITGNLELKWEHKGILIVEVIGLRWA